MFRTLLLLATSSLSIAPTPAVPSPAAPAPPSRAQEAPDPAERYRSAAEARDAGALGALWRELPTSILPLFDGDLEGALSLWERSPEAPDRAGIERLLARARFAAEVASEVTGRPIFADYAASFAGWDDAQKRSFRAGQAAYGAARRALGEGNAEAALTAAVECRDRALPLGDWWGAAMGLEAEARALDALDRREPALTAASRARLLYAQLGLAGSELGCVLLVLDQAERLGRPLRARVAARAALALIGDGRPELAEELNRRLADLERRVAAERAAQGK